MEVVEVEACCPCHCRWAGGAIGGWLAEELARGRQRPSFVAFSTLVGAVESLKECAADGIHRSRLNELTSPHDGHSAGVLCKRLLNARGEAYPRFEAAARIHVSQALCGVSRAHGTGPERHRHGCEEAVRVPLSPSSARAWWWWWWWWLGACLRACLVLARTRTQLGSASAHDAHRNTAANQRARANTMPVVQSAALRALAGWADAPQASLSGAHGGSVRASSPPPPVVLASRRSQRGGDVNGCRAAIRLAGAMPALSHPERCSAHPPASTLHHPFSQQRRRRGTRFFRWLQASHAADQPTSMDLPALHSVPPARPARAMPDPCRAARSVRARGALSERLRRPHRRTANHPLRGLVIGARLDLQSSSRTSWRPSPGCSDHSTPP
ncbi:hypothetical protein B0J12DRAFT_693213 [Macrophomina phaseolina]|uniref:Uncharacterized protein n=1 Tax=Macrophomina phaseolina TaxID=35725 RepID=A0ABQ8GUN0_9PEZI|nr:hypothetical protein B0J12DRAFT_693213 [Macrophomina phaseolina]